MILVGNVGYAELNASRGQVAVVMETGDAKCSSCGERIPKNSRATYAWDEKRHAQPSRLHVYGEGTVEVRHAGCSAASSVSASPVRTDAAAVPPVTGYKQTSREAYLAALPSLTATQRTILDLYAKYGGMTDEELYDRYSALDPTAYRNTVLPARNALYQRGAVIETSERRAVRSGRTAIVWDLL